MKKSQYLRISKTILLKLYANGCWGAGSMYEANLKRGIKETGGVIDKVIVALTKQKLIGSKPHKFGRKLFLNRGMQEKIKTIVHEKPRTRNSLLLLLM